MWGTRVEYCNQYTYDFLVPKYGSKCLTQCEFFFAILNINVTLVNQNRKIAPALQRRKAINEIITVFLRLGRYGKYLPRVLAVVPVAL
jgi:hypothetical protein